MENAHLSTTFCSNYTELSDRSQEEKNRETVIMLGQPNNKNEARFTIFRANEIASLRVCEQDTTLPFQTSVHCTPL